MAKNVDARYIFTSQNVDEVVVGNGSRRFDSIQFKYLQSGFSRKGA